MEKNQGKCCENFFKKICHFPSRQRGSSPSMTASSAKNREAEVVLIEFDYTSQFQQKAKLPQVHQPLMTAQGKPASRQPEKPPSHIPWPGRPKAAEQKTAQNIDDQSTDYINRAKIKIRKMSSIGEGNSYSSGGANNQGRKESKDNHFSEFIKRAGMKIRTTSSIKDRME